ncbi:hypothetical protein [Fluviicola taffensis]|nr:hypothetical protein [Fluviicola taffensis]
MKKITIIASLLVVFAACQKADIHPNTRSSENSVGSPTKCLTPELKNGAGSNSGNTLSTGTGTVIDSTNPDVSPEGGDITDPLRKKDKKDMR